MQDKAVHLVMALLQASLAQQRLPASRAPPGAQAEPDAVVVEHLSSVCLDLPAGRHQRIRWGLRTQRCPGKSCSMSCAVAGKRALCTGRHSEARRPCLAAFRLEAAAACPLVERAQQGVGAVDQGDGHIVL